MPESDSQPVAEAPVETPAASANLAEAVQELNEQEAANRAVVDGSDPVPGPTAVPVTVDNRTKRSDEDALLGSWVDVIAGQHAARFGSYVQTVSSDPTTGYPRRVLVRTRDALNELIEVEYEHLRPSERTGGR